MHKEAHAFKPFLKISKTYKLFRCKFRYNDIMFADMSLQDKFSGRGHVYVMRNIGEVVKMTYSPLRSNSESVRMLFIESRLLIELVSADVKIQMRIMF